MTFPSTELRLFFLHLQQKFGSQGFTVIAIVVT